MSAEWQTPREAAERLGVGYRTVLDGCARDEIPHRRIGRALRVPSWWIDGADLEPSGNGHTPDAGPALTLAAAESQSNAEEA